MRISKELRKRYKLYSDITGMSVEDAIEYALDDWMNVFGEGEMEYRTGIPFDTDAERLGLPVTLSLPAADFLKKKGHTVN